MSVEGKKKSYEIKNEKILVFDTEGNPPGHFEKRIRFLLADFDFDFFPFERKNKKGSLLRILRRVKKNRPSLVVMEGTGVAGGLACLLSRVLYGVPYVFSSGDAVGPFLAQKMPLLTPFFYIYEYLLYRLSKGFIGWTPYYCGRAITMGAQRTVTAANWAPFSLTELEREKQRKIIRQKFGFSQDQIVVGMIGALRWNRRFQYCYGKEIIEAVRRCQNPNVMGLVIGDGDGREHLKELAGDLLDKRIFVPGRIDQSQVPHYLAAMDLVTLPQTLNGVGNMRYTTKLSEYLAARVPVAVSEIAMTYDFGDDWLWPIAGDQPWSEEFVSGLGDLLEHLSKDQIRVKRDSIPEKMSEFDASDQQKRVGLFIRSLLRGQR